MRLQPIGFCLAVLAAACGTDRATTGDDDGSGDPGGGSQDPGGGSQDPGGGTMLPPPARGFQVVSPPVMIAAGQEITYCYYFKTSNTAALPVQSWKSHMSAGSHHMILYFTKTEEQPAGTVTATNCGGGGGGLNAPVWTYASQVEDQEFTLPGNDGTGLPLAQNVLAGQPAYIQMHYLNATDHAINAHVELNANAYPEGVAVRGAAPYITYKLQISIDAAQGSKKSVTGECAVSPALKFFTMSTHVHKQGVHTYVRDGGTTIFESDDWEHPGSQNWDASPFFSFSSGKLSNQCDYVNATGTAAPIVQGPSAATNEMCMAVGYFFDPALTTVSARYCLN
jgi:hypothetical protein